MLQLKLLGIAADTAENGVDALEAWAPGRYAAVLADIHMPHMDGHELARRLRAAEADRGAVRTPIVAVTANAMKGEEERCLASGMDAYLLKPVSIERLRATLERWLPVQAESSIGDRPDQMEPIPRQSTGTCLALGSARTAPPLMRCWRNSAKRRLRRSERSTLPRAVAILLSWPQSLTS